MFFMPDVIDTCIFEMVSIVMIDTFDMNQWVWWHLMASGNWINIGSDDGLWPDGTKLLAEPMFSCNQWDPVSST